MTAPNLEAMKRSEKKQWDYLCVSITSALMMRESQHECRHIGHSISETHPLKLRLNLHAAMGLGLVVVRISSK